ncbi:MAG TPA: GGDEF domain-containing protein [Candidatus Acidoferrales bacterium]|nr:GGDEF domain-containing protein [Candidatus Acidoferrales bacterium]
MEEARSTKAHESLPPDAWLTRANEIRTSLKSLDRKQWWMWSSAVLIILLLTIGVASFTFPSLMHIDEGSYSFYLSQAVRGLVGLVLLFSVYSIYQQSQINKIRGQIADQMDSVAKVELLTEEVYKLAVLDPLTNLHNRRSGEQRLLEEIARSRRHARPLTILLLDLDDLKQCNDKFGHDAGDTMIRSFADRLKRAIRGSDLAVRQGGDEFMVILPECRAEEVRHVLGRLQGLEIECGGEKVKVTFACGWADYQPTESAQELLKRADEALYTNKRSAKDDTGARRLNLPVPAGVR